MTDRPKISILRELEMRRADTKQRLAELHAELAVIEKMIMRQKAMSHGEHMREQVTRKNVNRLYTESKILEILNENRLGMPPARLGQLLEARGVKINSATLRSMLSRMLSVGRVIKKGGNYKHPDAA